VRAVFSGSSLLSLDDKGRLSMPTRHRDALAAGCEGRVMLTLHPDGCVLIYPRPRWEAKRDEVDRLPESARGLRRIFVGKAVEVDLDGSGRLLVPQELRKAAALEREVRLMGIDSHLELWNTDRYEEFEQKAMTGALPRLDQLFGAEFRF
jgi:MraZ protein